MQTYSLVPRTDQERADLMTRIATVNSRLDDVLVNKTACAEGAASGDGPSIAEFNRLDAEEGELRKMILICETALHALTDRRNREAEAVQAERHARANIRRKAHLDAAEAEATLYYQEQIRKLEACGEKAQAEIWRNHLSRLRSDLEKQFPVHGVRHGESFVIGAPD